MSTLLIASLFVFVVAVTMTMVGKGGGNFYVVVLAMANIPMYEAATTGQFILFTASIAAMFVFQRNRSVSWTLAVLIGIFTAFSALVGGYFSHLFSGFSLKLIFAAMLVVAGIAMLIPVSEDEAATKDKRRGVITIRSGGETYGINLWIALPIVILTGFGSGMVGVSGGLFWSP